MTFEESRFKFRTYIYTKMKIIQSSCFRGLVAILVGAFVIIYRSQTLLWLTVLAGALFFLSGFFTWLTYYLEVKRLKRSVRMVDEQGQPVGVRKPMFPIVSVGSMILGLILALMPQTFVSGVAYILAAMLLLGAISQFVNLGETRRYASIPIIYWLLPAITFAVGVYIFVHPISAMATSLLIIGWCMIFYGVVELINTIHTYKLRKAFFKAQEAEVVDGEPQL